MSRRPAPQVAIKFWRTFCFLPLPLCASAILLEPNPARRLRLLCNYSLLRVKAKFSRPEPQRRVFYSLTPCGVLASPLPLWESIGRLRRPFLEKDAEAKLRLRRIDRCDPGEGLRPIDRP